MHKHTSAALMFNIVAVDGNTAQESTCRTDTAPDFHCCTAHAASRSAVLQAVVCLHSYCHHTRSHTAAVAPRPVRCSCTSWLMPLLLLVLLMLPGRLLSKHLCCQQWCSVCTPQQSGG
jgi:hypothetical protein